MLNEHKHIMSHRPHQCEADSQSELSHLFLVILWQLTWIVGKSDRLSVEGNQASAPAGWGAILRAWLQRRSSARNAASQQYACCYPRTTVSLSGSAVPREDTLPWGWEPEQMHAAVCQPLMPPGMWYVSNYHCCLPSEEKRSVLSQHGSQLNGCLIHHQAWPLLTGSPAYTAVENGVFLCGKGTIKTRVSGYISKWHSAKLKQKVEHLTAETSWI